MRYIALAPLQFKNLEVKAGETFALKSEDAIGYLVSRGLAKPLNLEFAWCYSVCILTPAMRKLCERVKPCPKEVFYE